MNMNNIKTVMLIVLMAVIMMLIGGLVGGRTGLTIMLFFSIAMNIYSYWYSDSLVLRWSGAQEVTREQAPQLYDLVEKLASRAGLPMPRVCIIDADEPNAFATGRTPEHAAVAVTTGIMRVLDYNEISGVLAHELAHVKNRDILTSTIASMMATVISYAAQFFMFFGGSRDDEEGVNPVAAIAMMILAPIAAMLIQMGWPPPCEYEADHDGGEICGTPTTSPTASRRSSTTSPTPPRPCQTPSRPQPTCTSSTPLRAPAKP